MALRFYPNHYSHPRPAVQTACTQQHLRYNGLSFYFMKSMKVELDIPESTFSALRQPPKVLAACIRLMAAAKLYETGSLSQERAAELAGSSHQEFLV